MKKIIMLLLSFATIISVIASVVALESKSLYITNNPFLNNDITREIKLNSIVQTSGELTSPVNNYSQKGVVRSSLSELESAQNYRKDQMWLVKYKSTVSLNDIYDSLANMTYKVIGDSDNRIIGLMTSDIAQYQNKASALIEIIEQNKSVQLLTNSDIEKNLISLNEVGLTVNDPYFSDQWALQTLNAPDAWNYSIGNPAVNSETIYVSVIDSGIDRQHPDLMNSDIRGGWDYILEDSVYWDTNGHGTQVSGIISASTNNEIGMAGMCWDIAIVPMLISYPDGSAFTDDLVEAIIDSADIGLQVINISMGSNSNSALLEFAVNYAKNMGCIVIASAGNDGDNTLIYPAACENTISVGSINKNKISSSFSNYNAQVDITAPGEYILTTNDDYYEPYLHYAMVSGTSFSAPYVSAIAALALTLKPNLSYYQFRELLIETSEDLGLNGYDTYYGFGLVNANSLLEELSVQVKYRSHIQEYGWENIWNISGEMSGTIGEAKRLEAIEIALEGISGGIEYRTHVQDYGWLDWQSNGAMCGTSGEAKRLEAIEIRLTDEAERLYDVYYRVHAENFGWLDWAKNGASSGTAGFAYRLEGIEIVLVEKGGSAPGTTARPFYNHNSSQVAYHSHVQDYGWESIWKINGQLSGTIGEAKRLEAIEIKLNDNVSGGIEYRTHVQDYGWMNWKSDGAMSGTSGESKRLEAIEIRLTGLAANVYDIYYRVHAQNFGWLGWAKNGMSSGTAGFSYRLEAIEILLVPKTYPAPGAVTTPFVQK